MGLMSSHGPGTVTVRTWGGGVRRTPIGDGSGQSPACGLGTVGAAPCGGRFAGGRFGGGAAGGFGSPAGDGTGSVGGGTGVGAGSVGSCSGLMPCI